MNLVMPLSRKKLMPLWSQYQLHVHILGGYFLICKMEIMRQVTVTFINTASNIFPNLKPFNSSSFYFTFYFLLFTFAVQQSSLFWKGLRQTLTMQPRLAWNSLCRSYWPQIYRDLLVSASEMLGLKVCSITVSSGRGSCSLTMQKERSLLC